MLIILATNNPHKRRQLRRLLDLVGIHGSEVATLADLGVHSDPVEDAGSVLGNATIKLRAAWDVLQEVEIPSVEAHVFAEDSGFFVPALGGAPGPEAAYWAGNHDEEANNRKLVRELGRIGVTSSPASYRAVVVFSPVDRYYPRAAWGHVDLRAVRQPQICPGAECWGYDPYVRVMPEGVSPCCLDPDEWLIRSHRGQALLRALERALDGPSPRATPRGDL